MWKHICSFPKARNFFSIFWSNALIDDFCREKHFRLSAVFFAILVDETGVICHDACVLRQAIFLTHEKRAFAKNVDFSVKIRY
jgi:hypothetical protein